MELLNQKITADGCIWHVLFSLQSIFKPALSLQTAGVYDWHDSPEELQRQLAMLSLRSHNKTLANRPLKAKRILADQFSRD
ncbi:MAG: hypothetical protein BGO43_10045 [Gammaproteobacteria bacterium 39-13]|jgi:hypothetical protein|nr:MAG: hypothetical protein BGO43_10045 [Gammaproteobacteria bacterium 39-13]